MSKAFEQYMKHSTVSSVNVETPGKAPRVEDLVDMFDSTGKWQRIRILPGTFALATYWIDVRKKDGDAVPVPKTARNFDVATGQFTDARCPYAEGAAKRQFTQRGEIVERPQIHYYVNVIDRAEQDHQPRKIKVGQGEKSGFKVKGSNAWTPVRVLRLPPGVVGKLQALAERNGADFSDPESGADLDVMIDKRASSPSSMYQFQPCASSPLKGKEREFLLWDVRAALESIRDAETDKEAADWCKRHAEDGFGMDRKQGKELDKKFEKVKKGKGKGKGKKRKELDKKFEKEKKGKGKDKGKKRRN